MNKLLELKEKIKSKLPGFSRKDSHKKKRLGDKWRRPKGITNKMRLQLRPHKVIVKTGYKSPKQLQDMNRAGLRIVNVANKKQLSTITKEEAVIISAQVSKRTLTEMLQICIDKKIVVDNIKNPAKKIDEIKRTLADKKNSKKDKIKSRSVKKAELNKRAEKVKDKKKDKATEESDEDKKVEEKKEKDKVLTQKA